MLNTEASVPLPPPHGSIARELESLGLLFAADRLELPPIDYMGMDDLLELAECEHTPELIFILMMMFAAMAEGSVCLPLAPDHFVGKYPAQSAPEVLDLLEKFLTGLNANRYERLISQDPDDFVPLIWVPATVPRLYFQKYYVSEEGLKRRLSAFLGPCGELPVPSSLSALLDDLYSPQGTIRAGVKGDPILRDPWQEQALRLSLTSRLTIISGGPGTGKTSLMVNLLRGLLRVGIGADEIILGAPTGRAAQRMTEAIQTQITTISQPTESDLAVTQLKGATIHRILKYDPRYHRFQYHDKRRLPARVIIVDEVSMVDVVMMDNLLQAVDPEKTRLIFLGDKHQLPSVEAGAVLADLIPQEENANPFKDHLVLLQTVFRSGQKLTRLAAKINSGEVPTVTPADLGRAMTTLQEGWDFLVGSQREELSDVLMRWVACHYLGQGNEEKEDYLKMVRRAAQFTSIDLEQSEAGQALLAGIFHAAEKVRILTITRVGPFGCEAINTLMGRILSHNLGGRFNVRMGARADLFAGALIIVRRNDYSKELFNGDMGVVLPDAQGTVKIYFKRSKLFFGFTADALPPFEPAFALTVHQSQGSEYEEILLILPDDITHRLLSREILYTAVTRAKRRVLIFGEKEIFARAVSRRILRQSGMVP